MLDSSSKRIFKVAAFNLFYGSVVAKIARAILGLALSLLFLIPLTTGVARAPYFAFSLLLAFLMFEAFFRFKLSRITPSKKTGEGEWEDTISLSLAKIMLKNPHWDSMSWTFSSLAKSTLCGLVLARAGFNKEKINGLLKASEQEKIDLTAAFKAAGEFTKLEKRNYIDEVDLLVALLETNPIAAKALNDQKLKASDLLNIAFWIRGEEPKPLWETKPENLGNGMGELWVGGWTASTEAYTRDLTKGLMKGEFDGTLIGRDKEIYQIEEVLSRTSKKNVILLGEPGVGKEALIYGIALKSLRGELPPALKYKRVLELDLTSLLASAQGGELESRVKTILEELSHAGNVILYLPQIENIAGGGTADLTSLLIGELERGKMQVIATTNRGNYHKFIEQKPAFSASFEIIDIAEPEPDDIIRILEGRSTEIEKRHKVTITYRALFYCTELARKYLLDRAFPGKAIDLLDEVAAAVALKKKQLVEDTDLEDILTAKTKVPVALAKGEESEKLLKLEEILHQRIVGQDEAIKAISEAVRRARTMERDTTRPIGVFLFLGPTGVGKTETAKALSQVYFGDEKNIIRLDMSEYEEETAINRLIGPPPGQPGFETGGQLTESVRARPFSLLLLDEMEKAHQKVQEAFLAIFDEGRIADSSGRVISFTNTIIISTSNAGAEFIRESIGRGETAPQFRPALLDKLQKEGTFKPEFLNRFDDVIVFKPLQKEEMQKVVELRLVELQQRLAKQDIKLELTPEALSYLSSKGYDPTYGARSLRRLLQDELEGLISKELLSQNLKEGSTAIVSAGPNGLGLVSTVNQPNP